MRAPHAACAAQRCDGLCPHWAYHANWRGRQCYVLCAVRTVRGEGGRVPANARARAPRNGRCAVGRRSDRSIRRSRQCIARTERSVRCMPASARAIAQRLALGLQNGAKSARRWTRRYGSSGSRSVARPTARPRWCSGRNATKCAIMRMHNVRCAATQAARPHA